MQTFGFYLPVSFHCGCGAIEKLGPEIKASCTKRVLIVTDPGVVEAGLVEKIQSSFERARLESILFDKVEPNPRDTTVESIAQFAVEGKAELFLALGGGSAMDAAKAAAVLFTYGGNLLDYQGIGKVPGPVVPLYAVPTTAGTGSEATLWSVIIMSNTSGLPFKMGIGSMYLAPRAAFLDPELTVSLPSFYTASTGIDALTHAVEAYICTAANPFSDTLALKAIQLIARSLEKAYLEPENIMSRAELLYASTLAGAAFGNADLGAVHSLSEAIGGLYDIGHGLANAIILPYVLDFNQVASPERLSVIAHLFGAGPGESCSEAIRQFISKFDLPRKLSEAGLLEPDLPALVERAMANSATRYNPREVGPKEFTDLLRQAY